MTSTSNSDAYSRRIPLIVAAAFFMESLDATIITTALPAMAKTFGATTLDLTASITIYLVAMTAFVPAAGWASGRVGARNLFAGAVAVFTVASFLCAVSPPLWMLIAARMLQGAAAAFMSPVGRLIVLRDTPKHHIIAAIGLIVWPGLIAPVIGPPLGGLITTYLTWQWIFFLNIPLGLVGTWLALRFIPAREDVKPVRFDAVGFVLTAAALTASIYGLSVVAADLHDAIEGALYVAGGIACGIAAIHHARGSAFPILDLAAAAVPTFALSTLSAGFVSRVAISMTPFLLPLMFQIGFHSTPFYAGMMLLVYMSGNLAMKSVTTPILRRSGFREVLRINGVLCVLSLIACGLLHPGVPLALTCAILFVAGMTRSMNFTCTSTLTFADIPGPMRAGATTLASMAQQAANAVGVAAAAMAVAIFAPAVAADALSLAAFQHAFFGSAAIMAIAVLWSLRLHPAAGAELAQRR